MVIGIDAREIENGVTTGIGRALVNFLEYFDGLTDNSRCVLFSSKPLTIPFGSRIKNVVYKQTITIVWDQIILMAGIIKNHVNLFFSPYYKVPLLTPVPCISTIFDLMYLTFEPYRKQMPFFKKAYYHTFGKIYAHKSAAVLTCSRYSQKEIVKTYHVKSEKISVIALGLAPHLKPMAPGEDLRSCIAHWKTGERFILFVGTAKKHKNLEGLIAAFDAIAAEFPDVKLVVAGNVDPLTPPVRQMLDKCANRGAMIFTGLVTRVRQRALYCLAAMVVAPSLYEGWGYPAIEAMACGTPVIASRAASLPEVVGAAARLVDPYDTAEIADAMRTLLCAPQLRRELGARGRERAQSFSARVTAQKWYELFSAKGN